ncbi:MAG: hypothetical protein J2P21_19555, partial [Chloracidobacterium sp.]|nr:hypothetical protein [Chloracidobacterium sp.]
MQKLFLAALVAGLCAPVIMAQDAAGIYGALPTPRFNTIEINKPGADFNSHDSTNDAAAPADTTGSRPRCRRCPSGYTHVELYGGYSFLLFDSFETNNVNFNDVLNNKLNFHGADVSATFNFLRYVGAQFDFSIHKRSEDLAQFGLTGVASANIQHYLFGFQVKNNSKDGGRFRPFGHFLLG